ncbi:MAG: cell wall metabolism sensor histidine kinase WalK [Ruminococcaceae bacterium]|nr:cell wall metabolism sensor histidine kinase WalK [Oscillospiraceae bacterium]
MYNRLRFKIILILVVFIFSVMAVVGTILLNSVFVFYTDNFVAEINDCFNSQMQERLINALGGENYIDEMNDILTAFSGQLGIDVNRDYYILDINGDVLASSSSEISYVNKTNNLLSAMNGKSSSVQLLGNDVMDYAVYLSTDLLFDDPESTDEPGLISDKNRECIIYISDTREEMQQFAWRVFSIIMQALLVGLGIALILSFFLAKAITSPIQNITNGAAKLAEGDFSEKLPVHSQDEIGVLTETFNTMANELKRTIDEVSGEREKLETIFAYLNDGVVAFDTSEKLMHINEKAKELLNVSISDDMSLNKFLALFNINIPIDDLMAGNGGSVTVREIEYSDKILDLSIGRFNIELEGMPNGGLICVIHDVSEHFALEKSRREFIATVSHELRTPLTGIRGATETVIENPDMSDDIKNHLLSMVIRESDRMTRIVRDLLMLSRLDNKKMSWKVSTFSPKELLEGCIEMLSIEAGQREQTVAVTESDNDIPDITADKERIEQVIINIVQNAMKYTPEKGTISAGIFYRYCNSVKGLKEGNYVIIKVRDNGVGIPEEDIPHLFERFYRVEKARSSETGGTGLGLSIANEIVLAHNGVIDVESSLGEGTTVYIYLPSFNNLK